jgi:uncharacterized delta-60 repeat protein
MKETLMLLFFLAGTLLSLAQTSPAPSGKLLKGKGNNLFSFEEGEGQVFWTDAVVHPEGFFTVAGTVLTRGKHFLALARFHPDGNPDCSFQNEGISELRIPVDWEYLIRIERLKDGKLLVLFNPPQPGQALFLARFSEDGYPDPGFGQEGILKVPIPREVHFMDMLVGEDGSVVVAGFEENSQAGVHTCRVMRILPGGQIDETFTPQPPPPTPHAYHLIALARGVDEKIMLAAYINGQLGVARLLPNGKKDPDFGEGECQFFPISGFRPYDLQCFPDGSWLVLGGGLSGPEGYPIAVKGQADGQLDQLFGRQGVLYTNGGRKIAAAGILQADGRWTITGMGQCEDQTSEFFVSRYLADGTPDITFGQGGHVAPLFEAPCYQGSGMWLKSLPGGKTLAGGTVNFKGALTCLDSLGQPVQAFGHEGTTVSVWGGDNPLDVDCTKVLGGAGGSLIATGTLVKPFNSEFLAVRVESNGTLDTTFHQQGLSSMKLPAPIAGIDAVIQADGKLILGGRMQRSKNGAYDLDFAACRLNPDGSLDTSFANRGYIVLHQGPFDLLATVALQPDGKILLAGDSDNPKTHERELLIYRLLPSGFPDPDFGAGGMVALDHAPQGAFSTLLVQQDGKLLLLDEHPGSNFDLLRLLPDGRPDRSFGIDGLYQGAFPDHGASLQALLGAITSDDHILIAGQVDGRTHISRLKKYGEPDATFGVDGTIAHHLPPTISEMALLPDDRFLLAGSGLSEDGMHYCFFTASLMPDGLPDPAFGENGLVITELPAFSYLSSLLILEDGTIILGGKGYSSASDTHSDMVLIRYLPAFQAGHLCPKHEFPFIDVYPYPLESSSFELTYDLPEQNEVSVTLHELDGTELGLLLEICRPAGDHRETLQLPADLPSGRYVLKASTPEVEATLQFFYHPSVY